ncbi:hypothetical protein [Pontibacter akesuensis]|uniref:Uncharacterized protein n=1 Tax=Pontibacter akesuensis TaxID=388950 RepID=A0A1I7JJY8_9BACT|nr:hypothetical protein [Pontibacter akesuensis]GHA69458.1 hypothetical protein GCM10007389_23200 [Pontibacter akesuensis]SFU85458.1 hypothetical protein SAMN04487941_2955 [Pontibacter akesuensis]
MKKQDLLSIEAWLLFLVGGCADELEKKPVRRSRGKLETGQKQKPPLWGGFVTHGRSKQPYSMLILLLKGG